ncbi:MAG: hypothetical protein ACI306_05975 [Muribaculaceae bacterium]
MNYSVAIRTLGTSPDTLRRELMSIFNQTVMPDKVVIYIARGYKRPPFTIGYEQYIEVEKGMARQRALRYDEIDSEYIMLLDDDVELAPDSAEKLLHQLTQAHADCMAVDTFCNHKASPIAKIKAAIVGWTLPRFNDKWAFKLHKYGSFSYINNPQKDYYPSQSAAGPASLWRKKALLAIRYADELWLDSLGFAYGEDEIFFNKLVINGGSLYVSFNNGVTNLDARSSSSIFKSDKRKFYIRAKANYIRWYRIHYEPANRGSRIAAAMLYTAKSLQLALIHLVLSLLSISFNPIVQYTRGLWAGIRYVRSSEYRQIPPYKDKINTLSMQ